MEKLEVIVKGQTGVGKSHVMAIIERALMQEYGHEVKITSEDLRNERNQMGDDIRNWASLDGSKVEIVIKEENVPRVIVKAMVMQYPHGYPRDMVEIVNRVFSMPVMGCQYDEKSITIELLKNPEFSITAFQQCLSYINDEHAKHHGDIDWGVLLFRETPEKVVNQATMIVCPLTTVRENPVNGNIMLELIGRRDTCENNSIFAQFIKQFSDGRRLDKSRTIKLTNEYMVRTVRE